MSISKHRICALETRLVSYEALAVPEINYKQTRYCNENIFNYFISHVGSPCLVSGAPMWAPWGSRCLTKLRSQSPSEERPQVRFQEYVHDPVKFSAQSLSVMTHVTLVRAGFPPLNGDIDDAVGPDEASKGWWTHTHTHTHAANQNMTVNIQPVEPCRMVPQRCGALWILLV